MENRHFMRRSGSDIFARAAVLAGGQMTGCFGGCGRYHG